MIQFLCQSRFTLTFLEKLTTLLRCIVIFIILHVIKGYILATNHIFCDSESKLFLIQLFHQNFRFFENVTTLNSKQDWRLRCCNVSGWFSRSVQIFPIIPQTNSISLDMPTIPVLSPFTEQIRPEENYLLEICPPDSKKFTSNIL